MVGIMTQPKKMIRRKGKKIWNGYRRCKGNKRGNIIKTRRRKKCKIETLKGH
jgi:hypothetical protein